MNKNPDTYFTKGCGRCKYYDTPHCKVLTWKEALITLRALLKSTDLTETSKWGSPCYTYNDANVIMIQSFKGYCALMFFKGTLIQDPKGLFEKAGNNTSGTRQIQFTDINQVKKNAPALTSMIKEAIQIEQKGLKPEKVAYSIEIIPELQEAFKKNPTLKKAFESLTPGRQRGYHIFFSQAKQSTTRSTRIEKYIPSILAGKGMQD